MLYQKVQELAMGIEALEIMPDQVHMIIESDPSEAPQRLPNPFKGFTAQRLRQKYPRLRSRFPNLWNMSISIASKGQVFADTVKRYIKMQ